MEQVLINAKNIIKNVAEVCESSGRNPSEIEIMGASKLNSIEPLLLLNNSGLVTTFGENRVQEMLNKYDSSLVWDMIGQLQTNKVKYIIDKVRYIHSVDRLALAEEINKQAHKIDKVQQVLIEINSGAEITKGGILLEKVADFLQQISNLSNIKVVGLMAVAPISSDEQLLTKLFTSVKNEFDNLQKTYTDFKVLSMGMSNDYKIAIKCGSTLIRVGRQLFGERNNNA